MARVVRFRVLDGIAVVTLDAPPVNALSPEVRAGLWEAFGRIADNDDISAAVLVAEGALFSAGADIREFDATPVPPSLSQLCSRIEDCTKPVVAGLHGQVLGGGAELALAAHYRLATEDVRFGLPDVSLGLVPGGGGTQRLPRLIGPERALQLLISTQSIDSAAAHQIGVLDGKVDGDLTSAVVRFAQGLVAAGKGPRPTRKDRRFLKDGRAYQTQVTKARAALAQNPLHAPQRVIDCVEAAALLPFEAGLALEEDALARCLAHPQSIALRHVYVAERQADSALLDREGAAFKPVEPMGKSAVQRLRTALRSAADDLVSLGHADPARIDGALIDYGFRKGPYGGKDAARDAALARRLVAAMMVEGAGLVEEGAVQRPSDVDALAVHGMGFPRRQGGPMRAAQTMGLLQLRQDMREWESDSARWAAPELLNRAVLEAGGFDAV
ncbi:MAG: enoyl-CoA hydratase-related protein [Pseudomonadota bacterium]